jgi:hypothetical protein
MQKQQPSLDYILIEAEIPKPELSKKVDNLAYWEETGRAVWTKGQSKHILKCTSMIPFQKDTTNPKVMQQD